MQQEDIKIEAPESLKMKCLEFLDAYKKFDEVKTELENKKKALEKEFDINPNIKSVNFPELKLQVQGRDCNKIIWDVDKVFKLIGPTVHASSVFPTWLDKNKLTDEDIQTAGLAHKCSTRIFDEKVLEDLVSKKVYNINDLERQGVATLKSGKTIARTKLKLENEE